MNLIDSHQLAVDFFDKEVLTDEIGDDAYLPPNYAVPTTYSAPLQGVLQKGSFDQGQFRVMSILGLAVQLNEQRMACGLVHNSYLSGLRSGTESRGST